MQSGLRRSCEKVAKSLANNMDWNWKHVSFITDKNSIISVGWNHPFKSHPLAAKYGYRYNSIHSELHAILNFEYPVKELKKFRLVNVRVDKFGHMRLSKPCKICSYVINIFGLGEVWYTNNDGKFVQWTGMNG